MTHVAKPCQWYKTVPFVKYPTLSITPYRRICLFTHCAIIFRDDFSIHECNQALVDSRLIEVRRYNHLDHCTSSDTGMHNHEG